MRMISKTARRCQSPCATLHIFAHAAFRVLLTMPACIVHQRRPQSPDPFADFGRPSCLSRLTEVTRSVDRSRRVGRPSFPSRSTEIPPVGQPSRPCRSTENAKGVGWLPSKCQGVGTLRGDTPFKVANCVAVAAFRVLLTMPACIVQFIATFALFCVKR